MPWVGIFYKCLFYAALGVPGIRVHLAPKGVDAAGKGTSQPAGKFGQLSLRPLHEVLLTLRLRSRGVLVYGCFCIFYVVNGISGFFHLSAP